MCKNKRHEYSRNTLNKLDATINYKGGALAKQWTFNNCKIEVVNGFTYIDIFLQIDCLCIKWLKMCLSKLRKH